MELAYAGLGVADKAAMESLLEDILGLVPSESTPESGSAWTNDGKLNRVFVSENPANDLTFLGIEYSDAEYSEAIARLVAFGADVIDGSPEARKTRGVA